MLKEFKDFLMKGNLVEIATGLVLALAFAAVVTNLVDVINQFIAALLGAEVSFDELSITVRDGEVVYGPFLTALFSFVVIGFVLFLIVKAYNKAVDMAGRTKEEEDEATEVELLTEIRDLLRNQR